MLALSGTGGSTTASGFFWVSSLRMTTSSEISTPPLMSGTEMLAFGTVILPWTLMPLAGSMVMRKSGEMLTIMV